MRFARFWAATVKVGITAFPADFALRPEALARAVEERGVESPFLAEHTHLPATPATRKMLETVLGDEPTPPYARTHDVFVALSFAAASTSTLRRGESGASDA